MTTEPLFKMTCTGCNEESDWLDIEDAHDWVCEGEVEDHEDTDILEYSNIPHSVTAHEVFDAYDELGDSDEFDRWLRYVDQVGNTDAWALSSRFVGQYDSATEFAEAFAGDLYEIPENLAYYIDYERLGEDLMHDFYVVVDEDGGYELYHID